MPYLAPVRAVVQRVAGAAVEIEGKVHASIGSGLLILLAVEPSDSPEDIEWLSGKVSRLRIFDDADGVMNLSVREVGGEVLAVSQFTLYASTRRGNRPSYTRSASPDVAIPLYDAFVRSLSSVLGRAVSTGIFGADMQVKLVNDGPVTIMIDSKLRE